MQYVSIQVCKYASMQVCKYASMQVYNYSSMLVFSITTLTKSKRHNMRYTNKSEAMYMSALLAFFGGLNFWWSSFLDVFIFDHLSLCSSSFLVDLIFSDQKISPLLGARPSKYQNWNLVLVEGVYIKLWYSLKHAYFIRVPSKWLS